MSAIEMFLWLELIDSARSTPNQSVGPIDPLAVWIIAATCVVMALVALLSNAHVNRDSNAMKHRNNQRILDTDAYNATRPNGATLRPYGPVERWG